MDDKEKQKVAVLGRLLSLEMFLFVAGLAVLVSGIVTGAPMQLFYGGVVTVGSVLLHFVKKKDWKKHWEEQEMVRQRYEQRERKERERDDTGKE